MTAPSGMTRGWMEISIQLRALRSFPATLYGHGQAGHTSSGANHGTHSGLQHAQRLTEAAASLPERIRHDNQLSASAAARGYTLGVPPAYPSWMCRLFDLHAVGFPKGSCPYNLAPYREFTCPFKRKPFSGLQCHVQKKNAEMFAPAAKPVVWWIRHEAFPSMLISDCPIACAIVTHHRTSRQAAPTGARPRYRHSHNICPATCWNVAYNVLQHARDALPAYCHACRVNPIQAALHNNDNRGDMQ